MSFASLLQFSFPMLSIAAVVRAALMLALLASLLMFFRPLLSGILRALLLAVRSGMARKPALRAAAAEPALPSAKGQRA